MNFVAAEALWLFDLAIDIIESRTIVTPEDLTARVQRMERDSVAATGFPLDEVARQHALSTAVEETTTRVHVMLNSMVSSANAGLREMSFGMNAQTGPLIELIQPNTHRARVVEQITASRAGTAGMISASIYPRKDSLIALPVPWNQFEVLIAAEPHRLNVWTILNCEVEQGLTSQRSDVDSWSAHSSVPIESDLFRSTEVSSFLLKELGRFLDIFEMELRRRQMLSKAPPLQ